MEDYRKKYEEALGRAKIVNPGTTDYNIVTEIFPELKESEERIRKAIIKMVSDIAGGFPFEKYGIQKKEALAWLEKQDKKDSQVILPTFTFDDILALQCCMKKVQKDEELYNQLQILHDRLHDAYWLEKQGEQKPNLVFDIEIPFGAKDSELQEVSYCIPEGFYAEIDKNQVVIKKVEQKSDSNCLLSWSEIDEKMLQSLEGIVKDYWAKAEREKNEIKIREASNVSFFLKTIQKSPLCWIKCSDGLPNRDGTYLVVTDGRHNDVYDIARYDSIEGWHKASEILYWMPIPQLNNKSIIEQKPTWSEEDESLLQEITNDIKIAYERAYIEQLKDIYSKQINWLKSLKERYTWKPNDEQMEALLKLEEMHVLEHEKNQENAHLYMVIKSLKEQLLKLKGE